MGQKCWKLIENYEKMSKNKSKVTKNCEKNEWKLHYEQNDSMMAKIALNIAKNA